MSPTRRRAWDGTAWRGRGGADTPTPNFLLGVTEATSANTGAGVLRAAPTTYLTAANAPAGVTVSSSQAKVYVEPGVILRDFIVADRQLTLKWDATGVAGAENCIVTGAVDGQVGTQLPLIFMSGTDSSWVPPWADIDGPADPADANLRFCTVIPQTPSPWQWGIGPQRYYAYRCKVRNAVDGFGVYTSTSGGRSHTRGEACYVDRLAQFQPDPANGGRSHTHNDGIQFQGNLGGKLDSMWIGNSFHGRPAPDLGQPSDPYVYLAALTVSPNTQSSCSFSLRDNIFTGGATTVNASTNGTGSTEELLNNRFEKPGAAVDSPARALTTSVNSSRIASGNTYLGDGSQVYQWTANSGGTSSPA